MAESSRPRGRGGSLVALVLALLGGRGTGWAEDPLVKVLRVVDGDTIVLGGRDGAQADVAIYGILATPAARARVVELVGKELVAVRPAAPAPDTPNVGVIFLSDGRSLGEVLLEEGLVWWDRDRAPDAPGYGELEEAARRAERGTFAPGRKEFPAPRPLPPWGGPSSRTPESMSLPELEALMDATSPEARAEAAQVLGTRGPEAVPALMGGLRDGDDLVWRHAAASLARLGSAAAARLAAELEKESGAPRDRVVRALALVRAGASAAVPYLVPIVSHEPGHLRSDALLALGSMGDAAGDAVPSIVAILSEKTPHERLQAARALGRVGAAAREAAPELRHLVMGDDAAAVRDEAARALELMGEPDTVAWLVAQLQTPRAMDVIPSIGRMGPRAAKAIPALVAAAKEPRLRINVSAALGDIGVAARDALPLLQEMLDDPSVAVRANAEISLVKIGLEQVPLATVAKLLASSRQATKIAAAQALNARGADAAGQVQALATCLGDPVEAVRANCLHAIAKLGPKGAPALDAVVPQLKDRSYHIRVVATWAIAAMGADAEGHVMDVAALLEDPVSEVRRHAAQSLGKMGPVAREAIEALGDHAESDPDPGVRRAAAAAVGMLRP